MGRDTGSGWKSLGEIWSGGAGVKTFEHQSAGVGFRGKVIGVIEGPAGAPGQSWLIQGIQGGEQPAPLTSPRLALVPRRSLAAVVIVNLKGMVMQFTDVFSLWKANRMDLVRCLGRGDGSGPSAPVTLLESGHDPSICSSSGW